MRETILWGRKSGTLIVKCAWSSLERTDSSSEIIEAQRAERAKVILANWPSASVASAAP